jgi:outer membrane protein OmpA-like peptidoglycan-associated protein
MKSKAFFAFLISLVCVVLSVSTVNAQVDVPRKTMAIVYPPGDKVDVQFRGTTRFPRMKGSATVERTARKQTQIKLNVENMPRPFELGPGYATYVVWAVSPDGQFDNLGEIKRSGTFFIDSKIEVTTPLQTFALIITAEPHYRVTRPSQQIMLENLNPVARNGKHIDTLPAIQYFGNSSDYFRDPRTPEIAEIDYSRTPSTILQAKQAVALARFAGAERDAAAELSEAQTLLQNAENAWQAGRDFDTIDIAARSAISAAVKAESTAVARRDARQKRDEKLRNDAEIRRAEDKFSDAQGEIASLKDELARETRNRELAERDVLNYTNQVRDLRDELGRLREEMGRLRVEADDAKAKLAAMQLEKTNADQQHDRELKEAALRAAEPQLIDSLKAFGTVVKNERGIVLTLPENFWTTSRSTTLAPRADGKLTSLAEILSGNPAYRISVESHTDSSGDPDAIQTLTDRRAYIVADKFTTLGVAEGRIVAKGYGASTPIAPNTTARNRAKNRRMQVVLTLTPES